MPIFDYKCLCGKEKKDYLVFNEKVICKCGKEMIKQVSAPNINGMDKFGRSK